MSRKPLLTLTLVTLAIAVLAAPLQAKPEEEVALYQAVLDGDVKVKVLETKGHGKVLMEILNCTPIRRKVKFPGTYLKPRTGSYQRLALGYNERTKTSTASVPTVGRWKGWVTCCCMDHGKSSPVRNTPYGVMKRKAPKLIAQIMEHWAGNTGLKQSLVNEYVWGHKKGTPPKAVEKVPASAFDVTGIRLFAWGGRLLALSSEGELLRLRHDDKWECLGEGVDTVGVGWGRIFARFGPEDVFEYNETERSWAPRGTLPGAESFLPGPREAYALMGKVLFIYHGDKSWIHAKRGVAGASLSKDPDGKHVFAAGTPASGSGIKRSSSEAMIWTASRRRGFRDVFATASTVYGLDRRGLVKITNEGYRRIRGPGKFFPYRDGIFRVDSNGQFEEYRDREGYWHRHGKPGSVVNVAVDAVDGTVYALRQDGKIVTLDEKDLWKDLTKLPEKMADVVQAIRPHEEGEVKEEGKEKEKVEEKEKE